jgi:hypothetical protein
MFSVLEHAITIITVSEFRLGRDIYICNHLLKKNKEGSCEKKSISNAYSGIMGNERTHSLFLSSQNAYTRFLLWCEKYLSSLTERQNNLFFYCAHTAKYVILFLFLFDTSSVYLHHIFFSLPKNESCYISSHSTYRMKIILM